MLRMDKVSKKQFGHITEYFCGKNLNYGFVQVTLSYISPRRVHPCTHRPERELHPAALLLGKSGSKEVCFGCKGKDNHVQLPEEASVM